MPNLIISDECLDVRIVKQQVTKNIRWLNRRISSLDIRSDINRVMLDIYSRKMEAQQALLEWLITHENNDSR